MPEERERRPDQVPLSTKGGAHGLADKSGNGHTAEPSAKHTAGAAIDLVSEIDRILCNFGREGRPNKLILLHGPNGSSKSTIALCLMRALEHYSTLDAGALYRFHWVFPSAKTIKSKIGFGGEGGALGGEDSFA